MAKKQIGDTGFLPVTRRGFMVGTATTAAVVATPGHAAPLTNLRVETKYARTSNGQKLVTVTLRLSGEKKAADDLKLSFVPESFSPLNPDGVRLSLINLSEVNRDPSAVIDPGKNFTIRVTGADFLNQKQSDNFYEFSISSTKSAPDWKVAVRCSHWYHRTLGGPPSMSAALLEDVIRGQAGLGLSLGRGWIRASLSRMLAMPIAATGDIWAELRPRFAPNTAPSWIWTLDGRLRDNAITKTSDVLFAGGALSARSVTYGWVLPRTQDITTAAPPAQFQLMFPRFATTAEKEDDTPSPPAAVNTRLRGGTYATNQGTTVVLAQLPKKKHPVLSAEITLADADKDESVHRIHIKCNANWAALVTNRGETLADLASTKMAEDLVLSNRPSGRGWDLNLMSKSFELAALQDPVVASDPSPHDAETTGRTGTVRILTKSIGAFDTRDDVEQGSIKTPGEDPDEAPESESSEETTSPNTDQDTSFAFTLSLGPKTVTAFDLAVPVDSTPLTLSDKTSDAVFFRAVFEPDAKPVSFRLGAVGPTSGPHATAGLVSLDASSAALDLSLDDTRFLVRRPRDMLALDFKFQDLRVRQATTGYELYNAPRSIEETQTPDLPQTPVIIAEFPTQHVAEQAYFRREQFGEGLPTVKYLDLIAKYGGDQTADHLETANTAFDVLRRGTRNEKAEARTRLQGLIGELKTVIEALGDPTTEDQTNLKSINNVLEFDEKLADALKGKGSIPVDQRVYIGAEYLDPDVAAAAWGGEPSDLRSRNAERLISRLMSVEADIPQDQDAQWLNAIVTTDPLPPYNGPTLDELKVENLVVEPESSVLALLNSFPDRDTLDHKSLQLKLLRIKEDTAPDYAAFRDFWREQFLKRKESLPQIVFDEFSEFISVRHAAATGEPRARAMLHMILALYADPTGSSLDPFQKRARARHAAPSRLAFQWPKSPSRQDPDKTDDKDDAEGETIEALSLENLLDWSARAMLVPRRAQVVLKEDATGQFSRVKDSAQTLQFQGIAPDTRGQGTSTKRAADIWASSSRPPAAFETSIELPFRLNLAPAQDAIWTQQRAPESDLFSDPPETKDDAQRSVPAPHDQTEPIWTVALANRTQNPNLRAVWSADFRPESFLKPFAVKQGNAVDEIYDQPARGPFAPWRNPLVQRDAEGNLKVEETSEPWAADFPDAGLFRTGLDAYDRDQLVKLTSVYGMPVTGRVDPATNEIRSDASSFVPPEGYELLDLEVTKVKDAEGNESVRDVSTIYEPRTLDFSELRLSAVGGTLNLDTAFELPMPPRLRDGTTLYAPPTVKRWQQRTVLGRDIRTEIAYKGYLLPFGVRATLVKVTERVYRTAREARTTPTAFLIQRMYINISDPVKSSWYDQPDNGRGWPCKKLTMLTRRTPDLMDPTQPFKVTENDKMVVTPNGRLLFKATPPEPGKAPTGYDLEGLVFWPRTAPFESATLSFEFQIDDAPDRLQLPLMFVDAEAAQTPDTLARVCDHYNSEVGADTATYSVDLPKTSPRILRQPGTARPYARELSEGDSSYETMAWVIGVEGRPGVRTDARAIADTDKESACPPGSNLRVARKKALGARENYTFGPLLAADDQPPFYPFVEYALLRVDRVARLTGQRRGPLCLTAFDKTYLKSGLPKPQDEADGAPPPALETILGIMNKVRFDVGKKGDRIGAIGRPAGYLAILTRNQGPVTSKDPLKTPTSCIGQPPDAGTLQGGAGGGNSFLLPGVGEITNVSYAQAGDPKKGLEELLKQILGDGDAKILGVFKLTEVIKFALATAEQCIPQVSEALDYAADQAINLLNQVRDNVVQPLFRAVDGIDAQFQSASLDLGLKDLELDKVYPAVAQALSQLRNALKKLVEEQDDTKALALLPTVPAAGKGLLEALDDVARDPISPVKIELKRLFLNELQAFEEIVEQVETLAEIIKDPSNVLDEIERAVTREVHTALADEKDTVVAGIMSIVPSTTFADSDDPETQQVRTYLRDGTEDVLTSVYDDFITAAVGPIGGESPRISEVAQRIQTWDGALALRNSISASQNFQDLAGMARDKADYYAEQVILLYLRVKEIEAEINEAVDAVQQAASKEIEAAKRAIEARVRAEGKRLVEEASMALFGVSPGLLQQTVRNVERHTQTLTRGATLEARVVAVVNILREIDTVLLGGAMTNEAQAALRAAGAAIGPALSSILDGYNAILDMTAGFAGAAWPAATGDPATDVKEIESPSYLKDTSELIDEVITAIEDVNTPLDDVTEELDKVSGTLALARTEVAKDIGFDPLRTLLIGRDNGAPGLINIMETHFDDLSGTVDGVDTELLRETQRSLLEVKDQVMRTLRRVANGQAKANHAFQSYIKAVDQAKAAVAAAQNSIDTGTVTVQAFEALVTTFPKHEFQNMLRAWPKFIQGSYDALEDLAKGLEATVATTSNLKGLLDPIITAYENAGTSAADKQVLAAYAQAILALEGWAEEKLAEIALPVLDYLVSEIERLPDFEGSVGPGLQKLTEARANALRTIEAFETKLKEITDFAPVLRPVSEQFAVLRAQLSVTMDTAPLYLWVGRIRTAADALRAQASGPAPETPQEAKAQLLARKAAIKELRLALLNTDGTQAPDKIVNAMLSQIATSARTAVDQTGRNIQDEIDQAQQAVSAEATRVFNDLREAALAEATHALASLQTSLENQVDGAANWLAEQVFAPGRLSALKGVFDGAVEARETVIDEIDGSDSAESLINAAFELLDIPVAPAGQRVDIRHLFLAVANADRPLPEIYAAKQAILGDGDTAPDPIEDRLTEEAGWLTTLNAEPDAGISKVDTLRRIFDAFEDTPGDISILQIVTNVTKAIEDILRADFSSVVDFSVIRKQIEDAIRKMIPNKVTTNLSYQLPIGGFKNIFEPVPEGSGVLRARSTNTISLGNDNNVTLDANASATLSPFRIQLLGSFDALTLYFSEAKMDWKLGESPKFSLDFLDYEIGKELEFVQELASSLSASKGGAYIQPARGFLGIEAGYRINIPAINLGGVTFMNVGLGASAILPFEKRKALFAASLSSRRSPFIIIAGVWGGGGHFKLTSDGRRIVGFDASFVFGGGGAIAYGPLVLEGRVTVGVFIRKAGSYTELQGDFFAGGSGSIAFFGISTSILVTLGMDGGGNMTGSAILTYSFKIGFAKIKFSITLFKKEGKGFSSAGAEQSAHLRLTGPTRFAGEVDLLPLSAEVIEVKLVRLDKNYREHRKYYSRRRSARYVNGS